MYAYSTISSCMVNFFVHKNVVFGKGNLNLFRFLSEVKAWLTVEMVCCYADGSYTRQFKR